MSALSCFFSLGTAPRLVRYAWRGPSHETRFAIEAALKLGIIKRGSTPVRFFPILTPETEKLCEELKEELDRAGLFLPGDAWSPKILGTTQDKSVQTDLPEQVIEHILRSVRDEERVFIEPTAGLRPIQMALLASALFLGVTHRGVCMEPMFYSELHDQNATFQDLSSITSVLDWTRDARAFADHLHAEPLLKRLRESDPGLFNRSQLGQTVQAFVAGTAPLVLAATRKFPELGRTETESMSMAPSLALALVNARLGPLIVSARSTTKDQLDEHWLEAELILVETLERTGRGVDALPVLREWIVNVVLWASKYGEADWNNQNGRRRAESWLTARTGGRKRPTPAAILGLVKIYDSVSQTRNDLVHGYRGGEDRPPSLDSIPRRIRAARVWWVANRDSLRDITFAHGQEVGAKPTVFLNLSNHRDWPPEQEAAARAMGADTITYHAFPEVDPDASEQDLNQLRDRVLDKLELAGVGWALVQGEPVMAVMLVKALQQSGVTCFVATTPRDSVVRDGVKTSVFRFGKFRAWPTLGGGLG